LDEQLQNRELLGGFIRESVARAIDAKDHMQAHYRTAESEAAYQQLIGKTGEDVLKRLESGFKRGYLTQTELLLMADWHTAAERAGVTGLADKFDGLASRLGTGLDQWYLYSYARGAANRIHDAVDRRTR